MTIIHLTGPSLAGKSYLIEKLKDEYNTEHTNRVLSWTMLEWYFNSGCMDEDLNMDWDLYTNTERHHLADDVISFCTYNEWAPILIFESSGINHQLNKVLEEYDPLLITLHTPTKELVIDRAKKRNIDPEKQLRFNMMWRDRFFKKFPHQDAVSQEKAIELIATKLCCPICGTPRDTNTDLCCLPYELGQDDADCT